MMSLGKKTLVVVQLTIDVDTVGLLLLLTYCKTITAIFGKSTTTAEYGISSSYTVYSFFIVVDRFR